MYYPCMLHNEKIDHRPVFDNLTGDPFVADLSPTSPLLEGLDGRDQKGFQKVPDEKMGTTIYNWGFAPYLESREPFWGTAPRGWPTSDSSIWAWMRSSDWEPRCMPL